MRGLNLFSRTSARHCWTLASFHSPKSLTWSWSLSFRLFRGDEWRVLPFGRIYRNDRGLQWWFRIPWIGIVEWSRQQSIRPWDTTALALREFLERTKDAAIR